MPKDVTRFRRDLRNIGFVTSDDALALLDLLDMVYEEAEAFEDGLKPNTNYRIDLTETNITEFVEENADRLVVGLARIEYIGIQGVIDDLVAYGGYERVEAALADKKRRDAEYKIALEELGDLGDYPPSWG